MLEVTAREGLHQYRQTCQGVNIASLQHVVQEFRKAAEDKVNEARKQSEAKQLADMDDLDEMENEYPLVLKDLNKDQSFYKIENPAITSTSHRNKPKEFQTPKYKEDKM